MVPRLRRMLLANTRTIGPLLDVACFGPGADAHE